MSELPTEAWLNALSGLSGMGPARLGRILARFPARDAWVHLQGATERDALTAAVGRSGPRLVQQWCREARGTDVAAAWQAVVDAGIGVAAFGAAAYPHAFANDPEPPAVVYHCGDPGRIAARRVAIVGTRRCSRYGAEVAREFGFELAAAGVSVVSGLALGIDAAAHRGALHAAGAAPVAVVGSGLDVVYPRANSDLWSAVGSTGVIFSEAPLGVEPAPWRFPARNRLIAALADLVVVVESHRRGGSMHTVAEAAARDRQVLAVPGPIRSAASLGTNQLLAEGCAPASGVDDILMALGMTAGSSSSAVVAERELDEEASVVLAALGWSPRTFAQVCEASPLGPAAVAAGVARLVDAGLVVESGAWLERSAAL